MALSELIMQILPVARKLLNFSSYLELTPAAILKEFMMHTQKDNHFFLSRRNFILGAFISPLLIGRLMADNKIGGNHPLSSIENKGFIILGGWVLLMDDLTENLG